LHINGVRQPRPATLRPGKANCLAAAACLMVLSPTGALAQDSHYWTHTYGTRASLLGGAVIGSVVDLSATYYNPGALPLVEDLDVVMTSTVFYYPNVWMRDIAGTGQDLKSSDAGQAPVVVAGMFKVNWHGTNRVGYSILTRQKVRMDFYGNIVVNAFDIPDTLALGAFTGDLHLNEEISETWFGLCWARSIQPGFGLGMTLYGTYRYQRADKGVITEALRQNDTLAVTRDTGWYSFSDYRLLLKLGASFVHRGITWGITVTTPSVGVYSTAKLGVNQTVSGYDLPGGGDTYLAANYQEDLKAEHKMPLSVGAGINYKYEKTSLHLSGEYFFPVGKYYAVKAEDFLGQTHGDTLNPSITNEARSVLNVAIGLEHSFREDIQAYVSFYTDFSSSDRNTDTNLSVTGWDIYSLMVGSTFSVQRTQFTLGLGVARGSETRGTGEAVAIGEGNEIILLKQVAYDYRSYKIVLGFSF
jgi:hypothetical protein